MRTSQLLLATLKETPAEAEAISHQLMLRAGMIRRVAAGVYTWLPLGLKVLRKVEAIVREEMNRIHGQEMLMPMVQPAELWKESGRWEEYGAELLRIKDRGNREFCLGPTHEEVITTMVRNEIRSYKQLPVCFYQIQTKFRDEVRPRFGVMRGREFLMKDAYSFHVGQESLQQTYDDMYGAYTKIFQRCGLNFRAVAADSGSIGGHASHEFHVLADSGEDDIVFSTESDYAANVELAEAVNAEFPSAEGSEMLRKVETPNTKTINDLVTQFDLAIEKTVKTLIVKASDECEQDLIALLVRGDHELNELKAEKLNLVASPLEFATEAEIREAVGAGPGSLGVVNMPLPVIADNALQQAVDFGVGANEDGMHYFGVNWQRDVELPRFADLRKVQEGDLSPCGKGLLEMKRGIEVGHIFQLGTKYSVAMNATVLTDQGKAQVMDMGCYGIGVSRVVAAAIEQNYDGKGIIWPEALAPYQLAIVAIGYKKSERVQQAANELYEALIKEGIDVLLDDRKERPGVMFADMELIGIPHRIVLSDKALDKGLIEYKARSAEQSEDWALGDLHGKLAAVCQKT